MNQNRTNKNKIKLINFNVPVYLLTNFDNLVRHKATSRTSMLLQLMERFVRDEVEWLEKDDRLNSSLVEMEGRNQKKVGIRIKAAVRELVRQERDNEPPAPMGWSTYDAF